MTENLHDASANFFKRNIKDFVFTDLFSIKKYVFELYKALHPEDSSVVESDIKDVRINNTIVNKEYNDVGFLVGDRLIVLIEEQSSWSDNILVRMLIYVAETIRTYAKENGLNLFSSGKISLPSTELYVVYTGDKEVGDSLSLREEHFSGKRNGVDVIINVIRKKGKVAGSGIVDQYLRFAEIEREEVTLRGRSPRTLQSIISRCEKEGVLVDYLAGRRGELFNYFTSAISNEDAMKMWENEIRLESHKRGLEEGEARGIARGIAEGEARGEARGIAKGIAEGEARGEARGIAKGIVEGEARGIVRGIEEGEAKIKASIVNNLSKQGYDKAAISRLIGISMNELESILE